MPNAGKLSEIAIEKESAWGTAVSTFTKGLKVNSFSVNPAITVEPVPEADNQLMSSRSSAGNKAYSVSFKFWLDAGHTTASGIGEVLNSLFGADAITGAGPYVHDFTVADVTDTDSYSIYRDTGTLVKVYSGFRVGSVKLNIVAGDPRISVEVTGIAKDEATISLQSLVFTSFDVMTPSETLVEIDSSANSEFESLDIMATRVQQPLNLLDNSRNIGGLHSTDFTVDVTLNGLEPTTETLRNKFLATHNSTAERFILDITISKSANEKLIINLPVVVFATFDGGDIDLGAVNKISATGVALRSSSLKYSLINSHATEYDA